MFRRMIYSSSTSSGDHIVFFAKIVREASCMPEVLFWFALPAVWLLVFVEVHQDIPWWFYKDGMYDVSLR